MNPRRDYVTRKGDPERVTPSIYQNLPYIGARDGLSFPSTDHPSSIPLAIYSRDHILRFNLSIVPGITEFRRKNNAYCAEHTKLSAIKHRCRPGRASAHERARPAFLCPRPDRCTDFCFFFSSSSSSSPPPPAPFFVRFIFLRPFVWRPASRPIARPFEFLRRDERRFPPPPPPPPPPRVHIDVHLHM